ncbi:phytanoyl-CoA dioxygenase family protein [Rheinheimera sp. YQF-2]|uniref:Phytanoyl-CoA dioxygenase family protein n=1 Tax=Rheinheimera lutimaris TaxID=2740584 RepID=A0A7Y5EKP8_9GAMM|nr:phytanoyl-CoA dioxygenase family protein [Rheinheimera lutimaris]NRQ42313.1 phytanoyl-CoA dioxygenase family protein [Rheinheimera lutimaris]
MDEGKIPTQSYGILEQKQVLTDIEEIREQFLTNGYAVLDAGLSGADIATIQADFDTLSQRYITHYGSDKLKSCDEYHTIRAPLLFENSDTFLRLALNPVLLEFVSSVIAGSFILNQQNAITNPSRQPYNQGKWHRDLPYQHFVSSRPIAVNALYCVDDFTSDNGSTYVLPFSHLREEMPSTRYIKNHAVQICAKAGRFIVINCMTFHTGGFNLSPSDRRAVNHLFNIPFFKQQIKIPGNLSAEGLNEQQKKILGFGFDEIPSVDAFIGQRLQRL